MRTVSNSRLTNQSLIFAELVSKRDSLASCTMVILRHPYTGEAAAEYVDEVHGHQRQRQSHRERNNKRLNFGVTWQA